ncbi:MAG TPA: ammonium transporter [Opitutaceae bacterium]|nr:ammonium transporter [Opitutaceae bacterium]
MSSSGFRFRQLILVLCAFGFAAAALRAAPNAPARPESAAPSATVEQRLAALEAYVANRDPAQAMRAAGGPESGVDSAPLAGLAGPAHNTWMMISAALVLFMTLPGLALFYGGLVRTKNVLSVMAWCLGITSLVTVLWWALGYSLVFGQNFHSAMLGGSEYFFLRGVTSAPNPAYSFWVSQNVFAMFQLMFAIITPAVIIGTAVERMKFSAVLAFTTLWLLVVYCPLAHMVWGATGFMNGVANPAAHIHAIDFAGGYVVEMASGWSALMLCIVLGKRLGFGRTPMAPHSLVLCMVGAGMLWVGWYGFNAGSAVAADGIAANAFTTTTLAASVAAGVWGLLEYLWRGKASVLGFCTGAVAGLVTITPACGFVETGAAIWIGILGAMVPFLFCTKVKAALGYDDALDVFGVHGVGGTVGILLTGIFATTSVNPNLSAHLAPLVGHSLWLEQVKGIALTIGLAVVGTALIALLIKATIGLRPTVEAEQEGLDLSDHGEEGYIYEPKA